MVRLLASVVTILSFSLNAFAGETSLPASKDTFLRNGAPNTNEGANKKLNVRKVGRRRALLAFDLPSLNSQIPSGQRVLDAQLKLFVTNNNKVWGRNGNTIAVHRLLRDWIEGSGSNAAVPRVDKDTGEESDQTSNRGSGIGATWHCAADSNIKNTRSNCKPKWGGGTYVLAAQDTLLIENTTAGEIAFDVTDDVVNFLNGNITNNFGWLIRKANLSKTGGVWFASRQSSSNQPKLDVKIGYRVALTGAAEVPPVTTSASGSCDVWLGSDGTTLNVNCTHNVSNVSAAHIHTGAVGVSGGVFCDLGGGTSPIATTCTLDSATVSALNSGGLYVNIHSAANAGGEIRGQIQ